MCDGEQRDACILSSLKNLSLHIYAHSAGTLIQQSIFRSDTHKGIQCVTNEIVYVVRKSEVPPQTQGGGTGRVEGGLCNYLKLLTIANFS